MPISASFGALKQINTQFSAPYFGGTGYITERQDTSTTLPSASNGSGGASAIVAGGFTGGDAFAIRFDNTTGDIVWQRSYSSGNISSVIVRQAYNAAIHIFGYLNNKAYHMIIDYLTGNVTTSTSYSPKILGGTNHLAVATAAQNTNETVMYFLMTNLTTTNAVTDVIFNYGRGAAGFLPSTGISLIDLNYKRVAGGTSMLHCLGTYSDGTYTGAYVANLILANFNPTVFIDYFIYSETETFIPDKIISYSSTSFIVYGHTTTNPDCIKLTIDSSGNVLESIRYDGFGTLVAYDAPSFSPINIVSNTNKIYGTGICKQITGMTCQSIQTVSSGYTIGGNISGKAVLLNMPSTGTVPFNGTYVVGSDTVSVSEAIITTSSPTFIVTNVGASLTSTTLTSSSTIPGNAPLSTAWTKVDIGQ